MEYHMFIGRFQPFHLGHQQLFNTYLKKGEPVLIAVRNCHVDEKNPLSTFAVVELLREVYRQDPLVEIIVIPDIASINYGRDVGYAVNALEMDESVKAISATEIRNSLQNGDNRWREWTDPKTHELLEFYLGPKPVGKKKARKLIQ